MTREQRILILNSEIIMGFGLIFAIAAWAPVYPFVAFFFDVAHWPFHAAPDALGPSERLMIAISGGLTVGLGAMIFGLAREVLPVAPVEARRVIRWGAWGWFAVDSTFSVVAGSPFNVVLNLSFLAMMVVPLGAGRPAEAGQT